MINYWGLSLLVCADGGPGAKEVVGEGMEWDQQKGFRKVDRRIVDRRKRVISLEPRE